MLYLLAIGSSLCYLWLAGIIYVLVAGIWPIPDRRIERIFEKETTHVQNL